MACTSCKKKKAVETAIQHDNNAAQVSQFTMRSNTGVQQIQFGSGILISNANMTDELAIEFLRENPNRISLFEIFPENWKKLLVIEPEDDKALTKGHSVSKSK